MTGNTGLLTQRCDPFGAENERPQLLGGVMGDNMIGKIMWRCEEQAIGRYRMVCTGGDYGFRAQNDGGLIKAYHCDGGHKGQVMPLCKSHVRDFTVGPPKAGYTRDLKTPVGQIGGTVANELCPACAYPPEARQLSEVADRLQQEMSAIMARPLHNLGIMTEMAKNRQAFSVLERRQDVVRARLDELHQTGRVHKCPLTLREVS
jgi:hypothetical protein